MSEPTFPPAYFVPIDPPRKTAAELNAEILAKMAESSPVLFLGISECGRRLNLGWSGIGTLGSEARFFTQAELRQPATLEALFSAAWLKRHFPHYQRASFPEGWAIIADGYDPEAVFDWILDRCFETAGLTPPGRVAP